MEYGGVVDARAVLLDAFDAFVCEVGFVVGEGARTVGVSGWTVGAARTVPWGEQKVTLHARSARSGRSWEVRLEVRTSFVVVADVPFEVSFVTCADLLDPAWPPCWHLYDRNALGICRALRRSFRAALLPFLDATSTPGGLVRWMLGEYAPMRLLSASPVRPVERALLVASLLPAGEQVDAVVALHALVDRAREWLARGSSVG